MDLAFKDRFADTALSLKKSENYCIYIVLSHSSSVISKAIYLYTRDEYTHAPISLSSFIALLLLSFTVSATAITPMKVFSFAK
jgi:hypothetical protein